MAVVDIHPLHSAFGSQVEGERFVGELFAKCISCQQSDIFLADVTVYFYCHPSVWIDGDIGTEIAVRRLQMAVVKADEGGVVVQLAAEIAHLESALLFERELPEFYVEAATYV